MDLYKKTISLFWLAWKFSENNFIRHFRRCDLISSPEPKAQGELIVWDSSRRLSVRASVRPCVRASVHTFKH